MKRTIQNMWVVCLAACALQASSVFGVDTVYLANGQTLSAKSIVWRESTGEYRIETTDNLILPVPKAQVARLDIAKPPDFDKAQQMVAGSQVDAAIPILTGLIEAYRMRVWDNKAREILANIYLNQKNDPKKAIALLEDCLRTPSEGQADLRRAYWTALIKLERFSTLTKELDDIIATGPRDAVAVAQIVRGDMFRAREKKEEAFKDYMRTALLFKDIKSAAPEALFKAAEMLDLMHDQRATLLRKELIQDYPDSKYAAEARGKT